eukprot:jgi/Mesen1/9768/ME000007S09827
MLVVASWQNVSGGSNAACIRSKPPELQYQCFFGQYTLPFIRTPFFVLNSNYDIWSVSTFPASLNSTASSLFVKWGHFYHTRNPAAQEGCQRMREKGRGRENKRPPPWLSGVAAKEPALSPTACTARQVPAAARPSLSLLLSPVQLFNILSPPEAGALAVAMDLCLSNMRLCSQQQLAQLQGFRNAMVEAVNPIFDLTDGGALLFSCMYEHCTSFLLTRWLALTVHGL